MPKGKGGKAPALPDVEEDAAGDAAPSDAFWGAAAAFLKKGNKPSDNWEARDFFIYKILEKSRAVLY